MTKLQEASFHFRWYAFVVYRRLILVHWFFIFIFYVLYAILIKKKREEKIRRLRVPDDSYSFHSPKYNWSYLPNVHAWPVAAHAHFLPFRWKHTVKIIQLWSPTSSWIIALCSCLIWSFIINCIFFLFSFFDRSIP